MNFMDNLARKFKTPEEYLAFERSSVEKHEYYEGEVFAMSGASMAHNKIQVNFLRRVGNYLDGKQCDVFTSELRVHIPLNNFYTYPDALIVCDEPNMTDDEFDTILNPTVVIEILSKSTQNYDRGDKFAFYRSIPTLKEYILISSIKIAVEHYTRQENNSWLLEEIINPQDPVLISSINFSLPLAEIYDGVKFK